MELYKIVLSDEGNVKKAGDVRFAPLNEEYAATIAGTVKAEAGEWRLCVDNESMHADDIHDTKDSSTSYSHTGFENSVVKGLLVSGGHFAGVVLFLRFTHGGGMSCYEDEYYCILHADGRISGKNEAGTVFTGEDSDSENINRYTLVNVYGNKPVEAEKSREGIFVYEVCGEKENACMLTEIGGENVGELKIPEKLGGYTVITIAPAICKGREDIEALEIPDTVEEIGEEAFAKCSRMRTLKIGKGLRAVGENGYHSGTGTFHACTGLETIEVHPENEHFRSHGNCLIRIEKDMWLGIALNRDAVILGCKNTDLTKTKGIYEIENYAFYGCEGLKKVVVPKVTYRVGRSAFEGCKDLKKAILFKGTDMETAIGAYAFRNCEALEYVFIEKGLRWIEEDSFDGCSALQEICHGGTARKFHEAKTGYNHTPYFDIPVRHEQTPKG